MFNMLVLKKICEYFLSKFVPLFKEIYRFQLFLQLESCYKLFIKEKSPNLMKMTYDWVNKYYNKIKDPKLREKVSSKAPLVSHN